MSTLKCNDDTFEINVLDNLNLNERIYLNPIRIIDLRFLASKLVNLNYE